MTEILFDRYKIVEKLSSGSFSDTFFVEDLQSLPPKQVLIKSLQPLAEQIDAQLRTKLFLKEASLLKQLSTEHPQIPSLFDYFHLQDRYYLVQEYIPGNNLRQLGKINSQECIFYLSSLLDTLKYIHRHNIIHRNLKPENIIIRASDRTPVLTDFGSLQATISTTNIATGSQAFTAPEQSTDRTVFSSDLYSLALSMISCLTGKMPREIPINPQTQQLDWQQLVVDLDPRLASILEKASQIDLASRYPTANEMAQALHLAIASTRRTQIRVTEAVNTPQMVPDVEQNRQNTNNNQKVSFAHLPTIVITALIGTIAVTGGFWMVQSMNHTQRRLAEIEQEKAQTQALLREEQRKRAEAEKLRQKAEQEANQSETKTIIVPMEKQPLALETTTNARVGGTTGSKNIRSGPGTNYQVIGSAYTGQALQVIGSDRDRGGYLWYRVYHPQSGTRGWMAAQLVSFN